MIKRQLGRKGCQSHLYGRAPEDQTTHPISTPNSTPPHPHNTQPKHTQDGKTISKPIYNHVNGTLDTPETIEPTPIVIVEGLHPMYDSRVRDLLDFSLYLDISDEVKFAWKIQRDMEERGHSLESIQASIEARKVRRAARSEATSLFLVWFDDMIFKSIA